MNSFFDRFFEKLSSIIKNFDDKDFLKIIKILKNIKKNYKNYIIIRTNFFGYGFKERKSLFFSVIFGTET